HHALTLAQGLSHPYSLVIARWWMSFVSQWRRDVSAVHEQVEACIAISTEQGFLLWVAAGAVLRGWVLATQGQSEEGMALIRQGSTALRATGGAAWFVPYSCILLAEVCASLGRSCSVYSPATTCHIRE